MAGMTICLSYVVITVFVGQVSLMQVALAGASGFVVSHLAQDAGIGFPLGAIAGTLFATVLGFVAGASALRVRGVSLAVVTLAAAVAIEQFGFANSTWGAGATGSPVPELDFLGIDLGTRASFRGLDGDVPSPILGFVVLAAVIVLGFLVAKTRRSGLGRRMLAVRSNERAAAATGVNVRNTKFAAYAISSFIAGVGGVLYGYSLGSVSAERFGILIALGFVAFAYVGGITMVSGAVFGGLIATSGVIPHIFEAELGISGTWTLLVAGVTLILNLILFPDGVAGSRYQKKQQKLAAGGTPGDKPAAGGRRHGPAGEGRPALGHGGYGEQVMTAALKAEGESVSFGGVQALVDVGLEVPEGAMVGLIGPNGAGKTTFIDAITGFVRSTGRVELYGRELSRLTPHERARSGLARTWQATELFDDLTVAENLAVASESPSVWGTLREILWRSPSGEAAAHEALSLVGLDDVADRLPDQLSQGERKLVGVGRARGGSPRVVCFDEPAAGLDSTESEQLGRQLRRVVDQGAAVLLVDHDMGLVLSVCDHIVVLEFGEVIATGTPDEVRRDPRVVEAYLGGAGARRAADALDK